MTIGIGNRVRTVFDVDLVTGRFYKKYKAEHDIFVSFIKGVPDQESRNWYASVILNRLMFIYFIQKKGFLDNDINYLQNKLSQNKIDSKDRFFKDFLCVLFFDGLAKKKEDRSPEIERLLGDVPYIDGSIFLRNKVENQYNNIQIADTAFDGLFTFFERYKWRLDERPLRNYDEINPNVLGYIFEKYINQKQMGAYYTKENITEYICKNSIIPFIFHSVKNSINSDIWHLLGADPDRYIYDALKKGVGLPLPKDIEDSINDVSKRTNWNEIAPPEYALPTETWREVVTRRNRYIEIRNRLANAEIHNINDLITLNLDICQFAQDVIQCCDNQETITAFWRVISKIKVLDPTCGSGAFLLSAINVLEPLYKACIDRMKAYCNNYYIVKSIITNNIYGVDIMDEAVEICKLRLFLKLMAQIDNISDLEPLPDIDFNIRSGNTLVEYAKSSDNEKVHRKWLSSHKPFHWCAEYSEIMQNGGFDIVIGNPPYVEYNRIKRDYIVCGYETEKCGNLYAFVMERSLQLIKRNGFIGMIVPLSIISTERMKPLQSLLSQDMRSVWISSYNVYPRRLFEGVKQRLCIVLASNNAENNRMYTTRYNRWKIEERDSLFQRIYYYETDYNSDHFIIPKLQDSITESIFHKLNKKNPTNFIQPADNVSFYIHQTPYNFIAAFDFAPYFWNELDGEKVSVDYKPYRLAKNDDKRIVLAILNSTLFFWWWHTVSDGYHCCKYHLYSFPYGLDEMSDENRNDLAKFADRLMIDLKRNKKRRSCLYRETGRVEYDEFYSRFSKHIIDKIDGILAKHYELTDLELDFIINYDIKYRALQDKISAFQP